VFGIERGYEGLLEGKLSEYDARRVSDTVHRGGTILKTARSARFATAEGVKDAYEVLTAFGIEGLVVIGGDGSFRGMQDLQHYFVSRGETFACAGIPGTIDNDLGYTDFSLGFDTAVNTVLSALSNIRDTMTSHDRVCIVEVMGRKCGDIALYSALGGGAETILVPEVPLDIEAVVTRIRRNKIKGKNSDIIVLAEGVTDAETLKTLLKDRLGNEQSLRTIKLGYIQRGGAPSSFDRLFASRCAVRAVDILLNNGVGSVIGIKNNEIINLPIDEGLAIKKSFNKELYDIASAISG
jgi:6-phosphofructokinase 1